MKLELTIDRLVLDGYGPADASGLSERFSADLEALFVRHGVPPGLGEQAALPPLTLSGAPPAGAGSASIARALASTVYRGLGGRIE